MQAGFVYHCGQNKPTAAQQGAAPDRLQLRSSFLLTPLPAAGELVVVSLRAALLQLLFSDELTQIMNTPKGEVIVIHGDEWQLAYIEEGIAECKQLQWQKQKWFCSDALVYLDSNGQHGSSTKYKGLPYNSQNTILVKGGWDHDHCSICWWTLYESDDPECGVGYISGNKWLCCECYDKCIAST